MRRGREKKENGIGIVSERIMTWDTMRKYKNPDMKSAHFRLMHY